MLMSAPKRWPWVVGILVAALVGAAAGWGAGYVLRPPAPLAVREPVLVEVVDGEVAASVSLNAAARWPARSAGLNRASGVVTSLAIEGAAEVDQGSVLYRVGLRPVVAAEGAVPAFRPLSSGDRGDDVAQVQRMLSELGFYRGAVNGQVNTATQNAIRAWQRKAGFPVTGSIAAGDVVFLPELPARVALDAKTVAVGKEVAGGEEVVSVLEAAPTFTLPIAATQRSLIPEGTQVQITGPQGQQWTAVAGVAVAGESADAAIVPLASADGGLVCGTECDAVPVGEETLLSAKVITVPTQAGLVVPSAALVTGANGEVGVVDEDGTVVPVRVVASARGMSVIEGVERGFRVRVQQP